MVDLCKVLDNNYDYPKRPCENGCMDGCIARADCPLFQAWKARTEMDARLTKANQAMKDAGFETVEETTAREAVGLMEFRKWWKTFEPQIDPETYNEDEDETREAIARCTWKKCLEWMLKIVMMEHVQRIIKKELGRK